MVDQDAAMMQRLTMDLREDEGFRAEPYQDTEGFLTIGYGFLIEPGKGAGLPQLVADFWLAHNVQQLVADLRGLISDFDQHPEPVQRALANMAYQLGIAGLAEFRATLALVEQRRYSEAADEALNSLWAQQTPNRAQRVTSLLASAAASDA